MGISQPSIKTQSSALIALFLCSCTPWYEDYGIKSENEILLQASVPRLCEAARDGNLDAVKALGKLCTKDNQAERCLLLLLNDYASDDFSSPVSETLGVRLTAALAVYRNNPDSPKLKEGIVRTLNAYLPRITFARSALLTNTIKTLGPMLTSYGSEPVPALVRLLDRPDYSSRYFSITVLKALRAKARKAIPKLISTFNKYNDTEEDAAEAIEIIGLEPNDIPAIIKSLGHPQSSKRERLLVAIGRLGVPDQRMLMSVEHVAKNDPDADVKEAANNSLRKLKLASIATTTVSTPKEEEKPKDTKAGKIIVAVFDVQDTTGRLGRKDLDNLTNYLGTVLAQSGKHKVIPRDQLRARLYEEKKGTYKSCYEESCQIELGKELAAQKTLATTLIRVGSKCAVTANLFDLRSVTSEKGASVNTGCSTDELLDSMKKIAEQLSKN